MWIPGIENYPSDVTRLVGVQMADRMLCIEMWSSSAFGQKLERVDEEESRGQLRRSFCICPVFPPF
jgi:hypothetical protein